MKTAHDWKCEWAGRIAAAMAAGGMDMSSKTELRATARAAWRLAEALDRAAPPKPISQIVKEGQ